MVVIGSGLVGVACGTGRRGELDGGPGDGGSRILEIRQEDLDALPEMTEQEVEEFKRNADAAAQDVKSEVDAEGRPRIPPGQFVVQAMIVQGSNPSPRDRSEWKFYARGEVGEELLFSLEDFSKLKQTDQVNDVHCVTGWTVLDLPWGGVRVSDVLALAAPTSKARFVIFECENGYTTSIPIEDAMKPTVLIASRLFGKEIPDQHGGVARGMVPHKYFFKSGKWVMGLRLVEVDELGYWESKGYSNSADPWKQERYS